MDTKQMAARIAELEAQVAAKQKLSVRVNAVKDGKEEPTISVFGLQRFPVSLYPGQWDRLFAADTVTAIRTAVASTRK
jgi:hypothetical protein